jgi:hypothetical protein
MHGRTQSSLIAEQLRILSDSIIDILLNPDSPASLKLQLERFVKNCNDCLSDREKEEVAAARIRAVLPEILSKLQ